jgi:hypothetical protein
MLALLLLSSVAAAPTHTLAKREFKFEGWVKWVIIAVVVVVVFVILGFIIVSCT